MTDTLRLLCVLAHPDDESLGLGGILARYGAEGVATYLITATRGERGWQGEPRDDPGPEALGRIREAELWAAARVLGLRGVRFLGYCDGELDQADAAEAIAAIARGIRQIQPQVVVTFGPDGATGHPDHIAISQLTTAAVVCAADSRYDAARDWPPHRVAKLYYMAETRERMAAYDAVFGDSAMTVDGVARRVPGWEPWAITTRIDTAAYWRKVWQAIACHRSQLPGYATLAQLPDEQQRMLWGVQEFYRTFSHVSAGRGVERDLFAGLRHEDAPAAVID
jgi:LmbE family N-acetylglucosaminyl deacetylase